MKEEKNTTLNKKLEILITIVNRNKVEFFMDLIQSFDVNMQMLMMAEGTADQNMLNLLGLTQSEKAVILSVIQKDKEKDALYAIEDRFNSIKGAKGIAYTIPMSSIIGVSVFQFLSNNRPN